MNYIILNELQLKTFTKQDAEDYCQLNSINPDNITVLNLSGNELTDISGIMLFKNLKHLYIAENKLENIFILKYLNNLEILGLYNNLITDILILKHLYNLKELVISNNQIKDISVIKNLNNLEYLSITNLELESDQIKYINSLKNLKELWCRNGFKDISVLDKLNGNIKIIK